MILTIMWRRVYFLNLSCLAVWSQVASPRLTLSYCFTFIVVFMCTDVATDTKNGASGDCTALDMANNRMLHSFMSNYSKMCEKNPT